MNTRVENKSTSVFTVLRWNDQSQNSYYSTPPSNKVVNVIKPVSIHNNNAYIKINLVHNNSFLKGVLKGTFNRWITFFQLHNIDEYLNLSRVVQMCYLN